MSDFTKDGRLVLGKTCSLRLQLNKLRVEVLSKDEVVDTLPYFINPENGDKEVQTLDTETSEVEFMEVNFLF